MAVPKYLTHEEVQRILDARPKEATKEGVLNAILEYGVQIEGWNPPEPTKPATKQKGEGFTDTFIGGNKIARGLGQAIAQPEVSKNIQETQASQFDLASKFTEAIRKAKAEGRDTSRLEKSARELKDEIARTGINAEGLLNQENLTNKEVLGDALQLATTAVGGKVAGAITKGVAGGTGLVRGAIQGAKTGALTGAALGGVESAAQGLQNNEDIKQVGKDFLVGTVAGGVGGAVVGGAIGGTTGLVRGYKFDKANAHIKAVTPDVQDLKPKEYEALLNRGKITPKTATEPSKYILSDEEYAVANKYKSLLGKDPAKNSINISNEIVKRDAEVGDFLSKNKSIFNTGELRNNLLEKLQSIDDLTVSEERLSKLKESTVDNFIKSLKSNDTHSLWEARKEFDSAIKKAFSGSPTLQKEVKVGFRNAVQDFISEKTDDITYKSYMKDMSQLFKLRDIVNSKAAKEKALSSIEAFFRRNQNAIKILGYVTGGAGFLYGASNIAKAAGQD